MMVLMKSTLNAASENTSTTTKSTAFVIQRANGPVPTVIASHKLNIAMENQTAKIDLMKLTKNVVSKDSRGLTPRNAVVKKDNGNVLMVNVSTRTVTVMVKPNVLTNLMKVTNNAASEVSISTTARNVAATQNQNGPARMVIAS